MVKASNTNFSLSSEKLKKNFKKELIAKIIILENGEVRNSKIVQSTNNSKVDDKILVLLDKMQYWKPALVNKKPVASYVTIAITLN